MRKQASNALSGVDVGKVVLFTGVLVLAAVGMADVAHATTDANIEPAATQLAGYINGSGGKIAVGTALATAIFASVLRFNPHQVMGAVGVSLLATLGYPALTGGFTALI